MLWIVNGKVCRGKRLEEKRICDGLIFARMVCVCLRCLSTFCSFYGLYLPGNLRSQSSLVLSRTVSTPTTTSTTPSWYSPQRRATWPLLLQDSMALPVAAFVSILRNCIDHGYGTLQQPGKHVVMAQSWRMDRSKFELLETKLYILTENLHSSSACRTYILLCRTTTEP